MPNGDGTYMVDFITDRQVAGLEKLIREWETDGLQKPCADLSQWIHDQPQTEDGQGGYS